MAGKTKAFQFRISDDEKAAFELCAQLSGISLSAWIRERLRLTSIRELESANLKVPFVQSIEASNVGSSK